MSGKSDTGNQACKGATGGSGETPKQDKTNISTDESLSSQFEKSVQIEDEPKVKSLLDEVSFEGIARYIASDKCKNIVTMAGAGISTSAGIPDFRTPGTGLYDNLEKYNLPDPMAVFSIDYFEENPEPFFVLCKELFPGAFKPTPCHYFIRLLEKKKKLLTHFTQNIDTLERVTGLSDDKIVEAHGTFKTGHCRKCRKEYTQDWMKEKIFASSKSPVPICDEKDCDGVVKPDIVFFGESLPGKFLTHIPDLDKCDCLIVMGTSLVVQPFASLTSRTKEDVPRLYINLENTNTGGDFFSMLFGGGGGFNFDGEDNIRDVFKQTTCDNGCYALADLLGWGNELREMVKKGHAAIDKENAVGKQKPGVGSQKPATSKSKPNAVGKQKPGVSSQKPATRKSKPNASETKAKR